MHERGDAAEADRRSRQSLELLDTLTHVAPSLVIARADAFSLRGLIAETGDAVNAEAAYARALDLLSEARTDPALGHQPDFHQRFGDLLLNLAAFSQRPQDAGRGRPLLSRAVGVYAELAAEVARTGVAGDASLVNEQIARIVPALPDPERSRLVAARAALQRITGARSPR